MKTTVHKTMMPDWSENPDQRSTADLCAVYGETGARCCCCCRDADKGVVVASGGAEGGADLRTAVVGIAALAKRWRERLDAPMGEGRILRYHITALRGTETQPRGYCWQRPTPEAILGDRGLARIRHPRAATPAALREPLQ